MRIRKIALGLFAICALNNAQAMDITLGLGAENAKTTIKDLQVLNQMDNSKSISEQTKNNQDMYFDISLNFYNNPDNAFVSSHLAADITASYSKNKLSIEQNNYFTLENYNLPAIDVFNFGAGVADLKWANHRPNSVQLDLAGYTLNSDENNETIPSTYYLKAGAWKGFGRDALKYDYKIGNTNYRSHCVAYTFAVPQTDFGFNLSLESEKVNVLTNGGVWRDDRYIATESFEVKNKSIKLGVIKHFSF